MENFTITTRLATKQYAIIMLTGLYKKPVFIFAAFLGLYFVTTVVLDYFHIITWYPETPILEISVGLFLLLAPLLITILSVRQFLSNSSFQNDINYTFDDKGITIQGLNFKCDVLWAHFIKQKELGNFLILYQNKKFGSFIDKTNLTADQLEFIKSRIKPKL